MECQDFWLSSCIQQRISRYVRQAHRLRRIAALHLRRRQRPGHDSCWRRFGLCLCQHRYCKSIPSSSPGDSLTSTDRQHLHGSNPMYGLDYTVCYDPVDPVCHGGDNPADHYFYFTELGHCGEDGYTETVNRNITEENLNSLESEFYATAEVSTLASTADPDAEPSTTSSASTETSSASENDDDVRQDNVSEVSSVVNDSQDDEDSSASVLSHAITFIGVVGAVAFAF